MLKVLYLQSIKKKNFLKTSLKINKQNEKKMLEIFFLLKKV